MLWQQQDGGKLIFRTRRHLLWPFSQNGEAFLRCCCSFFLVPLVALALVVFFLCGEKWQNVAPRILLSWHWVTQNTPESGDPPPSNCTPTPSRSTQINATPLPSAACWGGGGGSADIFENRWWPSSISSKYSLKWHLTKKVEGHRGINQFGQC